MKLLTYFLKRRGIYKKFIRNFNYSTYSRVCRDFYGKGGLDYYNKHIDGIYGFSWSETPEGYYFWLNVANDYDKFMQKVEELKK